MRKQYLVLPRDRRLRKRCVEARGRKALAVLEGNT